MQILIVDLGSQYTLVISRRLRELGVRSIILPPDRVTHWLRDNNPRGIILSGGAASIYEEDAPKPPAEILGPGRAPAAYPRPILGICLGMHWLVRQLGGKVEPQAGQKEYGEATMALQDSDLLFLGLGNDAHSAVWMSHGDSVTYLPSYFRILGRSLDGVIAAISFPERLLWGVQFHPEVDHTEHGAKILENFLGICRAERDWISADVVAGMREEIQKSIPQAEQCVIAFSGGVDSTTLTAIAAPVLGRRLHCITIDAGNLREGELEEIRANAENAGASNFEISHVAPAFIRSIGATIDAELKRELFRLKYGAVLEDRAKAYEARFLLQGTLAPDRIESAAVGGSTRIKTHHNVGLSLSLTQFHPLGGMFKYEVRDLARSLGLPPSITERKPFPGPGLFCRIVGIPVTAELLELVRWADAEVRRIMADANLESEFDQLVVGLIGVRTVGVKGDGRSYGYGIGVRAVRTADFMTCRGYYPPEKVWRRIQSALAKDKRITRAWLDANDKPPATVEFE